MTYEINQSGRQEAPPEKAAPVAEAGKAKKCAACGREIGGGPRLIYMPKTEGKLKEVRLCPFCFLKIVLGVKE